MKKKSKLFLILFITIILYSNSFAMTRMIIGANTDFTSYLEEDESGNNEIKEVCNKFKYDYINDDMSDFEKEMQIIKYLTTTVVYDEDEVWEDENVLVPSSYISESFRAYGALINHKAVCAGYAKAFDLLARTCDLQTMIITGTGINEESESGSHAWNQVYLDGEWYNVDVTWETPIKNEYINKTDMEFNKTHIRKSGQVCTATKYGHNVVAYYLVTGIVDTNINLDDFRNACLKLFEENSLKDDNFVLKDNPLELLGAKFDDGSNYFESNEDMKITDYIKTKLLQGEKLIILTTPAGIGRKFSIDSGKWLNENININANIIMQVLYEEGTKYDARVILFSGNF